jgi:Cu2+-exporting ATPase
LLRVKPGEKFLLTEKLPRETTIDESMISGEPIPLDKKTMMQLLQVQLTEINPVMIAEKLVQKLCFRKLCKW